MPFLSPNQERQSTEGTNSTFTVHVKYQHAFSALLLVGRQEGNPACKNRVVGCWRGYLLERGADLQLHMAQLMPLPLTVSCFS